MSSVIIMHASDLVDFTQWCRSNGIPLLWKYFNLDGKCYRGSKTVLNTDLPRGTGFHIHIIRDQDFELVKLRLGKVFRFEKSRD